MASRKSTNISLIVLGLVSAGVLGYFVWLFLAPPAAVSVVTQTVPTEMQTGVVTGNEFQSLQKFANLPVKASKVGRANPFAPFAPEASSSSGVTSDAGGPKAPLINGPANAQDAGAAAPQNPDSGTPTQ